MNNEEVLQELHALWPRLRMRNPAQPEELERKRAIAVELEARFGPLLRPVVPARAADIVHGEPVSRELLFSETEHNIIYNPRLVHGNALKKHAHPDPDGFVFDKDYRVHLHGPQSHAPERF